MSLIINNHEIFQTNSSKHDIKTSNKHNLHRSNANLTCFPTNTFNTGIKILNNFPPSVTENKNDKAKFEAASRKHQHTHTQTPTYTPLLLCR